MLLLSTAIRAPKVVQMAKDGVGTRGVNGLANDRAVAQRSDAWRHYALARRHALQLAQRERHRREHDNLALEQGEHRRDGVVAGGSGEVVKRGTGLAAPLNA
jgi:hypothetical protein